MSASQISMENAEASPSGGKDGPPRRRRRGRTAMVVVGILVVAGGSVEVATVHPFDSKAKSASPRASSPTGLAHVTRGTLSARTQEDGTLGFAGDYQVVDKATGTVTELPAVGQVIHEGKALYTVDGNPVIFLYGSYVPIYRALSSGMQGADVEQLNAALVRLGYADKSTLDPDSDYFGLQTYNALRRLQHAVGLKRTGNLPLGEAVFLQAKEVRITKVNAVRGSAVGPGVILEASSMEREVTVALDATQQSSVAVGNKVTITLPTGKTTRGVVSSIGKVAVESKSKSTIDVQIKPSDPKATGELDQAPVQVTIASGTVRNALSVPVNALLALSGGGYAVEVVAAGGVHRLVAVTPGLFDDSAGMVQVTGAGLAVGQSVVVPSS